MALAIDGAAAYDIAHEHPDADTRKQAQAFYEFMVPLIKGYSTEMSIEAASLGVQVHGGMGFIEETGAALRRRHRPLGDVRHHLQAIAGPDERIRPGGKRLRGDHARQRNDADGLYVIREYTGKIRRRRRESGRGGRGRSEGDQDQLFHYGRIIPQSVKSP